jgi:DNA-binding NarL/FixJ family response regulator
VVGAESAPVAVTLPSDATAGDVLAALASAEPAAATRAGAGRVESREGIALLRSLTKKELIVLRMLAEGLTLRDIAARRGVSQNTVRTHIQNLYAKLGCHNRVEVVHFASRHGVVGFHGGSDG